MYVKNGGGMLMSVPRAVLGPPGPSRAVQGRSGPFPPGNAGLVSPVGGGRGQLGGILRVMVETP